LSRQTKGVDNSPKTVDKVVELWTKLKKRSIYRDLKFPADPHIWGFALLKVRDISLRRKILERNRFKPFLIHTRKVQPNMFSTPDVRFYTGKIPRVLLFDRFLQVIHKSTVPTVSTNPYPL